MRNLVTIHLQNHRALHFGCYMSKQMPFLRNTTKHVIIIITTTTIIITIIITILITLIIIRCQFGSSPALIRQHHPPALGFGMPSFPPGNEESLASASG